MALIVTIIVLLILAGVSIATLAGNNGLISRTTIAKEATRAGEVKELVRLEAQANKIAETTNDTQKTRSAVIAELVADGKLTSAEAEEIQSAETPTITIGGITIDFSILPEGVQVWTQNKTVVTDGKITLEVGTKITGYSVTGYTDLEWYVLGAEDGNLLITTNINPETVTLSGKDGYTGGVETLKLASAKYSDGDLAEKVRAINVDDINRVTGYDPATAGYGSDQVYEYGNQVTYTKKTDGKIYYKGSKQPLTEETSSSTSFEYWNGTSWITLGEEESATLTNTYYNYYPNTLTTSSSGETNGIEIDSNAYTLLFANTNPWNGAPNGTYWLESPYIFCQENVVEFGLRTIKMCKVFDGTTYKSSNSPNVDTAYGLRPVVFLKSSIKVTQEGAISK